VCGRLGIDAWIRSLQGGYHEVLRERGSNLSTGQKQLLACARILVQDPKILILDEATSSMDPQTEWLVRQALRKIMEGRTTLMIAHRLATVQDVERVVVLHHGKVVESGTHRELLRKKGHYAMLYRLQSTTSHGAH
jgi:ATP-binding cassette subfamily B protein